MDKRSSPKTAVPFRINGLNELWQITKGHSDVTVAILDGSVNLNHPCLHGSHCEYLSRHGDVLARSSHGTFITSLLAAPHNRNIQGIAPDCHYLIHDIYHETDNGSLYPCNQADIAQGISDALANGAHIINISGGERMAQGGQISPRLRDVLELCEQQGVLVVAATGNDGVEMVDVPAAYPTVLAVGSLDINGIPSTFSNWSHDAKEHGITLIGENITGACIEGNHYVTCTLSGTSFSTALVSGIVALLASWQQSGTKPDVLGIRQLLLSCTTTSLPEDHPSYARLLAGQLDLTKAIEAFQVGELPPLDAVKQPTSDAEVEPSRYVNQRTFYMNNDTKDESNVMPSQSEPVNPPKMDKVVPSEVLPDDPDDLDLDDDDDDEVAPQAVGAPMMERPRREHRVMAHSVRASGTDSPTFNPVTNQGQIPTFDNCQLVLAIGQPSYNFGTEANQDIFKAAIADWHKRLPESMQAFFPNTPFSELTMAAFLLWKEDGSSIHAFYSSQLIWVLSMNATPVYSITPGFVAFSDSIYFSLAQFLGENVGLDIEKYAELTNSISLKKNMIGEKKQIETDTGQEKILGNLKDAHEQFNVKKNDVMRMSLPGYISGSTKLLNGNYIQSVTPVAYGMNNWTLDALVDTVTDDAEYRQTLTDLLNRLYINTINRGQAPEERALNYAIYNIIAVSDIVRDAATKNMQFTNYQVKPSKIQRQNSQMREVQLTFFNPGNTTQASTTYAITVDISAITPIIVGRIDKWQAPISVASL